MSSHQLAVQCDRMRIPSWWFRMVRCAGVSATEAGPVLVNEGQDVTTMRWRFAFSTAKLMVEIERCAVGGATKAGP